MADKLNKFAWEVEHLPISEFNDWIAFHEYNHKEEEKAAKKANKKGRRGR